MNSKCVGSHITKKDPLKKHVVYTLGKNHMNVGYVESCFPEMSSQSPQIIESRIVVTLYEVHCLM